MYLLILECILLLKFSYMAISKRKQWLDISMAAAVKGVKEGKERQPAYSVSLPKPSEEQQLGVWLLTVG